MREHKAAVNEALLTVPNAAERVPSLGGRAAMTGTPEKGSYRERLLRPGEMPGKHGLTWGAESATM